MLSANGYQVDPDEVDKVVRTLFSQIDEFGGLCRQFGQLVPPMGAFGLIGSPAAIAAMTTHELLQRAQQALEQVLNLVTRNVQTAMTNYRTTDSSGVSGLDKVGAALTMAGGLIQRLQSTGLGAKEIHSHLQDQGHQVGAGLAEVHVGSNLSEVRLRPGDLVTTADFTATVGPDGRLYANGQPVQASTGQEARVYRSMPTGPSTR
jgi:hypothetical protein